MLLIVLSPRVILPVSNYHIILVASIRIFTLPQYHLFYICSNRVVIVVFVNQFLHNKVAPKMQDVLCNLNVLSRRLELQHNVSFEHEYWLVEFHCYSFMLGVY